MSERKVMSELKVMESQGRNMAHERPNEGCMYMHGPRPRLHTSVKLVDIVILESKLKDVV